MKLPATYQSSRYVGVLEVIIVRVQPLFSNKHVRKWKQHHGVELVNKQVRVFQGRMRGGKKYIRSSPIVSIEPFPDDSGHKAVLCENGNWYRVWVVIDPVDFEYRTIPSEPEVAALTHLSYRDQVFNDNVSTLVP